MFRFGLIAKARRRFLAFTSQLGGKLLWHKYVLFLETLFLTP
jgi:hypothetical protein